ncbi:hypothetical protein [Moorena producens]
MIATNRRFYLTGLRENQAKSLLNYRLAVNTVGLLANQLKTCPLPLTRN